ncbi:MAG: ABC transporter substrate-binding protein [Anaerolineae bacterium]|nr:ABC transporter substrate-binding protein [Anaerolineae bacterium]
MRPRIHIWAFLVPILVLAGLIACAGTPAQVTQPTQAPASTAAAVEPTQVTATSEPSSSTGENKGGGTFIFARAGDAITLDPSQTKENESETRVVQMFEGLVSVKPGTTELVPGLAKDWQVSEDGKTWTFHLREGVKFHDGTPFNADAVKFNFDRMRLSDNPYHIGEFNVWKNMMGGFPGVMSDVKVIDEYTVEFTLEQAMGPFLAYLAGPAFLLSSPTAIQADPENYFKNPVGTGPYKFVEWVQGDRVVMERFDDYWGEAPAFDRAIIRVIPDSTARFLELKAGTIHAMDDPNPDDIELAKSDSDLQVLLRDYWPVGTINVDHTIKPLDDVRVRWAIAHAIDREGLMPLYNGMAIPGNQAQTPASWAYNPDLAPIEYNPEKAKQLLADAGYPDGFEMDFWYMPVARPYYPKPAEIAQKMAADLAAVGIKVNLKTEDWGAYMNDRAGKFPMWMFGGWASVMDPSWLIYVYYGNKTAQEGNYDNAEVRDLMNKAQYSVDQEERAKLYQQAAKLTYDDMARIPVVFARAGAILANAKVKGFPTSVLRQERIATARFEE